MCAIVGLKNDAAASITTNIAVSTLVERVTAPTR
jgi:hypothetical protein